MEKSLSVPSVKSVVMPLFALAALRNIQSIQKCDVVFLTWDAGIGSFVIMPRRPQESETCRNRTTPAPRRQPATRPLNFYSFYPNGEGALCLVDESRWGYFHTHFVGIPMGRWQPPKYKVLRPSKKVRDFVGWDLGALVGTEKARDCLEPLIGKYAEFFRFAKIGDDVLCAVNVIEVIDCLDLSKSSLSYAPDDPKHVICAFGFVFDEEKVRAVPIFKVPQWMGSIFVSDEFAKVVVCNKLTGAGFDDPVKIPFVKKAWDRTMEGLPPVRGFIKSSGES